MSDLNGPEIPMSVAPVEQSNLSLRDQNMDFFMSTVEPQVQKDVTQGFYQETTGNFSMTNTSIVQLKDGNGNEYETSSVIVSPKKTGEADTEIVLISKKDPKNQVTRFTFHQLTTAGETRSQMSISSNTDGTPIFLKGKEDVTINQFLKDYSGAVVDPVRTKELIERNKQQVK